jgi:hypothetical protein
MKTAYYYCAVVAFLLSGFSMHAQVEEHTNKNKFQTIVSGVTDS